MGALYGCSVCWLILSIWGIIQLTVMALMYHVRAITLVEDVIPHDLSKFEDMAEFLQAVNDNYDSVARNCATAAWIYVVILILSFFGLRLARKMARAKKLAREDDEYFCDPTPKNSREEKEAKLKI